MNRIVASEVVLALAAFWYVITVGKLLPMRRDPPEWWYRFLPPWQLRAFLPSEYNSEGKRQIRWLWISALVATGALCYFFYLIAQEM